MKHLIKYFKPYILLILPLVALTYLQVLATLKLPSYISAIINEGIIRGNSSAIYNNGTWMLLVTLGGALCAVIAGYLASRIAAGFSRDIRRAAFVKIESYSINEFNKFSTASLITRSTNDVQQLQMFTNMLFRPFIIAPLMAIGALQNAFAMAPKLSWIIAVAAGATMIIMMALLIIALPKFKLLQKMVDRLNLVTRENLTGLRVVRAFNNEKFEEAKFEKANQDLTSLNLFVNRLMIILQPIMMLAMNLATVAIVWYGGKLIDAGTMEVGNMIAFMQYAIQGIMSFLMISMIFIMVPRASVSAKRLAEVIQTEPSIKDPLRPVKPLENGKGKIEFKNVSFKYPSADIPALENISFTAEPGQTTAIIGSTGSGKTTLVNMIPRFYDPSEGEILLDGINVKKYRLEDLYRQVGYAPQKAVLFSGTVKSNIVYGASQATEEDIHNAASIAQAKEFISRFPEKYETPIAQGGANASGGQKQRLSIARTLAVKPKLYIFDDTFSALDFRTDAKLRQALVREVRNKTVIIVGQRLSTIMNADKIIVLEEGRIVGQGKHLELLKTNHVYQEIAYSQLSDTELKSARSTSRKPSLEPHHG